MESFQGRAPPTGWNDLPANLSPNLKFGGGSSRTKRINRNNLYQQYYSNNSLYSNNSSASSQEYGLNQNQMGSQGSFANPNAPPPMMGQGPPPMMGQTTTPPPMMGSQNNLNQQPPMMGMQQQQQSTAQTPSVNYFNPASAIPAPTFNNQSNFNNNYQSNNFNSQPTTPNYGSNNSLNNNTSTTNAPISNISSDKKNYIMSIYNKHLDTYNNSCSLFQRRIYEDARQRINTMYEQLNGNMIDEQTVSMLEAIANALETKDSNTANTNVSYLMRMSNEKKWVLGVKELVDFICSN